MNNVLIVGAGPAGLGVAMALREKGVEGVRIVDCKGIGTAFLAWPLETRFISPSFPGHAYGCVDLNAIDPNFSPAEMLGVEHPSGVQYADYLRQIVAQNELTVEAPVCVTDVRPRGDVWDVETTKGTMQSRVVVWATGEFCTPRTAGIPGLESCIHYSEVETWQDMVGKHFLILGGGESGIDAACNLVAHGRTVTVLDRSGVWEHTEGDPSWVLSPITRERFTAAVATGRLKTIAGVDVARIDIGSHGACVIDREGTQYAGDAQPINCLGFEGGAAQIAELWDWENGSVQLTSEDESTRHPGLFLAGPQVRHPSEILCFIYKFRTRFPVVAQAIEERIRLTPSI